MIRKTPKTKRKPLSPSRKKVDDERKQRSRNALLDAATRRFVQAGYHNTLISDIVAEAGFGQGTFYRHFSSKREIFEVLFDHFMGELLAKIALDADELEYNPEFLAGPTAIGMSFEDPVTAAKLLNGFAKDHEMLKLRGAILEGKLLDVDGVKALAELPSREELLARVVGTMQAPISGMVNVLAGTIRGLVTVLERIKEIGLLLPGLFMWLVGRCSIFDVDYRRLEFSIE